MERIRTNAADKKGVRNNAILIVNLIRKTDSIPLSVKDSRTKAKVPRNGDPAKAC
jgi:hypothetical protein